MEAQRPEPQSCGRYTWMIRGTSFTNGTRAVYVSEQCPNQSQYCQKR